MYLGPMRRPLRTSCRRLTSLRRWVRAALLQWIASGAVIDEGRDAPLDEHELAALAEAIDRAREAGH